MADIYDMLSDATLEKIAAGGNPYDSMTDSELEAVANGGFGEQGAATPLAPVAPRMTREERIAQNQRAIERAQQPGEGENGFWGAAGEAALEGLKGGARAAKEIGGGILGTATSAVRLAGTPVRLATGWDGIHRLADTIDESYKNFGADALMSEYGENPDGWGYALGRAGEKVAGVAGALAGLGGAGKVIGAADKALKAAKYAKTAAAVENLLPAMFGNDAAVRAYDTARASGKSRGEAAALAGLNGAIHFFGFKAFENQSLKKMLNIGPEVEVMMPKWAGEMANAGGQSFSSLVRGTRNGMMKYVAAERGKGALKAGGIMGLQNLLSDPVMQVAEGADVDDIDLSRMLKAGAGGVGEGALMEGLMGGAAILRSQKAAEKFIADKFFRGRDYKVIGPDGREHSEVGLLNSSQGRMALMKQNPAATERILDIVDHGGKPTKAELDAAFLPPDMSGEELKTFRDNWRRDLEPYVDEAMNADVPQGERRAPQALNDAEMAGANAAERERTGAGDGLSPEEARDQQKATNDAKEKQGLTDRQKAAQSMMLDFESWNRLYAEGKTDMNFDDWRAAGKPDVIEADLSRPPEQESRNGEPVRTPETKTTPIQETPNETRNGADEAPAKPEEGAAGRALAAEAPRPVEAEPPRAEAPDAGVVEPKEPPKPAEPAPKPPEAVSAPETGKDNPAPKKPVEAAPRASGETEVQKSVQTGEASSPEVPAPTPAPTEQAQPNIPKQENSPAPVSRTVRGNLVNKRLRPIIDIVRNEDGSFNPDALRYHDGNRGLPLKDLKLLHEHPEIVDDLGFKAEDAANLRSSVRKAYEDGYLDYRYQSAHDKVKAYERGDGDLAFAYNAVADAAGKAKAKGDTFGESLLQAKLTELTEKVNALPEAERNKVLSKASSTANKLTPTERKNRVSLSTGEGKEVDVSAEPADETGDVPRGRTVTQGSTGQGGGLKGNRHIRIDGVNGDEITATMMDAAGKRIGKPQKMTRAQWEMLSKASRDTGGADPANPQKGDMIRMSRPGETETPEERNLRFATDENYQKWLKDRGANDAEPLRDQYEGEQAKAALSHAKNLLVIPGVEHEALDRLYDPAKDSGETITDRDSGRVVGTFNRDTGKVTLFKGANVKTVTHELGGHAVMRFAEQEAARGNRAILDKINESIDKVMNAGENDPLRKILDSVKERYPDASPEELRDEVWAAIREGKSEALKSAVKTLQGKVWYNRAWDAIKTAWKGILARMGFNRADLSGIDKMTPDEFNDFLDRTMAEGKTLGRLEKGEGEGMRNMLEPGTFQRISDAIKRYKDNGVKFTPFTESIVSMLQRGGKHVKELPGFKATQLVIESPTFTSGINKRLDLDHSAFNHNWEVGTAYTGYYTWPEFDRAFRPENIRNRHVAPGNHGANREMSEWTVSYPKTESHGAYSLTWRLVRDTRTGKLLDLYTTRNTTELPPVETQTPEGAQHRLTPKDVSIASSSGVTENSVAKSSAESKGANSENNKGEVSTSTDTSVVRASRQPKPAGYKIMDDVQTKGEKFEEKFIDARTPIRNVQDEIGGVKEVFDPRTGYTDHKKSTDYVAAADKANGRVEYEIRDLQHKSDAISKDLANAALKGQSSAELEADFDLYLQCRHAAERNRTIAERNKVTYDPDYYYGMGKVDRGGTKVGLSENVANDILAELARKYGSLDKFDEAAKKVYEINRADIQRRVEAGRLTVQDANQYLYRWNNYVPLKTDMERLEPDAFNSSTATMRRNEFRKARGRANADIADSPLAASILQAEQGIRGSVKNETLNVLANLVRHAEAEGKPIAEIVEGKDMPQGAGWTFEFGDGSKVVAGGEMKLAGNHPEIILFKEDGKLKAIRFDKGANGRGLAVAKSASGENMGKWGSGTEWIPRFTHWMSAMRTQYSPEFTVSNLLADHLEAYQALIGRYGIKGGTATFGKMVASEIQNAKDLKNYMKTGMMSRDVGEAVRGGLLTKGGVASEGFEGKEQSIRDRIEDFRRKERKWRDMSAADWAKSGWDNVRDYISFANEMAECSTRMGIFSALKKQGVPVKYAIKFARDATVNFNRKGTAMPYINGLYMFANASVQGAVRSAQAMTDVHGKELVALLTAVGVAKAVIDNYLGNDEDREKAGGRNARNLSEYDRKHNVGVPIPGFSDKQFVPLRFRGPYAAIPYLAQTAANVAMGNKSAKDGALTLVRELGDQVTDIVGGNGVMNDRGEFDGALAMQSIAPSVIDPFVQLASGKDYKGDERKARVFDKNAPVSSNGRRNTSEVYKAAAKGLNWLTGGNEFRKGLADIAPEDLQLVTEFLGGGPMRDVHNTVATAKNIAQAATGGTPERTLSQVPFLRRVVREYPENTSRYYDALDGYERDKAEYKKTVDLKSRGAMRKEKPYLSAGKGRVDVLQERIKDLSHLERGEIKSGQKWVERRTPPTESQKETFRRRRLELQAKVLGILGK